MAIGPAEPRPPPIPRSLLVTLLCAAFVLVGAGAFLAFDLRNSRRGAARSWLGGAIGGPFDLVDQNGKGVFDTDLREAGCSSISAIPTVPTPVPPRSATSRWHFASLARRGLRFVRCSSRSIRRAIRLRS